MSFLDDLFYDTIDDNKVEYLLSQLQTSGLSNEIKAVLRHELELFNVTPERYLELSLYISNSQMDLINSGFNYSQTDITRKLKKEIWNYLETKK